MSRENDVLIRATTLAERWDVSEQSLATMRSRGKGPAYLKLGGYSVRYRLSDVLAFEDEGLCA